jgi:chorismate synthase
VGLNPFRPQTVSRADVAMVVAAVLVVAALVAWALFG